VIRRAVFADTPGRARARHAPDRPVHRQGHYEYVSGFATRWR
jgi:hypothetical protein